MPKFEVRDSRIAYLVSLPGYEILSLVGPEETADFANQLLRQTWFLPRLLPPGARTFPPVPATIILQSRALARIKSAQIENSSPTARPWIMSPAGTGWSSGYPANTIRVWQADHDTFTVFSEYSADDAREQRAPTLRAEVQASLIWLAENRMLGVPRWYADELVESLFYLTEISATQATWEIHRSTGYFGRTPPALTDALSAFENGTAGVLARNKVEAFVHWAFWADGGRRREAFFKFIDQAESAPVTNAIIRESFGMESAVIDDALRPLETARLFDQIHRLRAAGARPPLVQARDVRPATAPEVARIMGAAYVAEGAPPPPRAQNPAMLERARTLLSAAYADGERDPRLLAVFGFLELATGRTNEATRYLEMAAAAKIVRPRVYLELAKIRLAEALSARASLDDATASRIMEPLLIAQSQLPEMQGVYELMLEIEARRGTQPPPAEIEILQRNIGRFREVVYPGFVMPARLLGGDALTSRWTLVRPQTQVAPKRTRVRTLINQLRENGGKWDRVNFAELK
jgi:hypothetical protein